MPPEITLFLASVVSRIPLLNCEYALIGAEMKLNDSPLLKMTVLIISSILIDLAVLIFSSILFSEE